MTLLLSAQPSDAQPASRWGSRKIGKRRAQKVGRSSGLPSLSHSQRCTGAGSIPPSVQPAAQPAGQRYSADRSPPARFRVPTENQRRCTRVCVLWSTTQAPSTGEMKPKMKGRENKKDGDVGGTTVHNGSESFAPCDGFTASAVHAPGQRCPGVKSERLAQRLADFSLCVVRCCRRFKSAFGG